MGWLLFGVRHLGPAFVLLHNMFSPLEINGLVALVSLVAPAMPVMLFDWSQLRSSNLMVVTSYPAPARPGVDVAIFSASLRVGSTGAKPFIYSRF